jgi:hypothetical protein
MSHPAIEAAKQNLAQMKRRAEEAGDEHIKAILNKVVADVEGSLVDVEGKMHQMDQETASAIEKANRQLEENRARAKENVEIPIAEAQAKAAQARKEILGKAGAGMPAGMGMGMGMPGMGMGFGGLPSLPRFDANAISTEAQKKLGEARTRKERLRQERRARRNMKGGR